MTKNKPRKIGLTAKQFQSIVAKRLLKYKALNPLEHYAMFMGMAQLLEVSLKSLLSKRYGFNYDRIERWTLGKVHRTLREQGVRTDLCALLKDIVEYRNYVAHDFLANEVIIGPFQRTAYPTKGTRQLQKWTIELEHVMLLCEQIEEHDNWDYDPGSADSTRVVV